LFTRWQDRPEVASKHPRTVSKSRSFSRMPNSSRAILMQTQTRSRFSFANGRANRTSRGTTSSVSSSRKTPATCIRSCATTARPRTSMFRCPRLRTLNNWSFVPRLLTRLRFRS
jgi:hypothetical protein